MNKAVAVLWVLVLVLAACGQPADGVPVVRAQPGTNGGVTTFQVEMSMESKMVSGQLAGGMAKTPPGMKVAYLFKPGNVQARLDLPASFFSDSKARILLTDQQAGTARMLLADTMQADTALPAEMLDQIGQSLSGQNLGLMDYAHPFRRLRVDEFSGLAKRASFDVSDPKDGRLIAIRTNSVGGGKQTMQLFFDVTEGVVTSTKTVMISPRSSVTATSKLSYVPVQGIDHAAVPYKIETKMQASLEGSARQPAMKQPVAGQRLAPKQKLKLKPGEYIANQFTAPVGEGDVDVNNVESEQVIEYKDIKVNQLTPDYFSVGGGR